MSPQFLKPLLQVATALAIGLCSLNAAAEDASSLRARYSELREQLANNNFKQALYIDSAQQGDNLKGDVYAVLEHPFSRVSGELKNPDSWCDILILPFNTKYCHAVDGEGGRGLLVRIGRKFDQPLADAYKLQFSYRSVAASADYFESRLRAKEGPLGTRDYNIVMTAVPLEGGRTFMHLSYSYGYGLAGKLAMQAYLSTVGADKIGFSIVGRDASGQPVYMGGVRGAVERNAMRYYLAINAYLDSLNAPASQQVERRIQNWFTASERYPRQLREMDRPTYVAMKRNEVERQQAVIQ